MRIYFDTEFYEDGNTIDLMSIGMVREDGQQLYLINAECDWSKPIADHWHRANTMPSIMPDLLKNPRIDENHVGPVDRSIAVNKEQMRRAIRDFTNSGRYYKGVFHNHKAEEPPEFWAWYADYDWVVLCQIFGQMIDLPEGWPMYCRDFKQVCDEQGHTPQKQTEGEHNALADALWLKREHERLMALETIDLSGNPNIENI